MSITYIYIGLSRTVYSCIPLPRIHLDNLGEKKKYIFNLESEHTIYYIPHLIRIRTQHREQRTGEEITELFDDTLLVMHVINTLSVLTRRIF